MLELFLIFKKTSTCASSTDGNTCRRLKLADLTLRLESALSCLNLLKMTP